MAEPWAVQSVEPVSDAWAVTDVKPLAPKQNAWGKATGFMANVNRGLGVGDEIAGGVRALPGAVNALGRGDLPGVGKAFTSAMATQRRSEDTFTATNPLAAAFGRGVGNAGTMAIPGAGTANALLGGTRAANAARGAVTSATAAVGATALDRGSADERLRASSSMATNPLALGLGAAGGALAPAARKVAKSDGRVLAEVGVSTSIPQRMGRAAKGVEDLMKRFPITGQAMSGFQDRQIGQLNRAIGLKALQPVGLGIPAKVKPGFEMVQYVDDKLGEVYGRAAKMVPKVKLDRELQDEFTQIAQRTVDLPQSEADQFARIIQNRTQRLQNGATGEMVKKIHAELGGLQAEAARKGQDTLSSMIGDTRRALMGTIARASPEAGRLIARADEGWGIYSIMNDAAAAASARGGVFLPGQLNTQVRSSAKRTGSNMAGKGRGRLQDIATAASQTIPDSYGNPGTANATLLAGGGVGAINDLGTTATAAAGLGAVATPYMLMGRRVLEALPDNASRDQLMEAAGHLRIIVARDPKVEPLLRQVSARLSMAGGVVPATSGTPTVEVEVPGLGLRGASYGPAGR